jgi:hypothetical protein
MRLWALDVTTGDGISTTTSVGNVEMSTVRLSALTGQELHPYVLPLSLSLSRW